MNERVAALIAKLKLEQHPEGGWFAETFRSTCVVRPSAGPQARTAVTDIYYLLEKPGFSRFHKVAHDELWHYYEGEGLILYEIDAASHQLRTTRLGGNEDGPCYQAVIRAGNWQAAVPAGSYALAGCTVAPGFEFEDFTFLKDEADAVKLIETKHPDLAGYV